MQEGKEEECLAALDRAETLLGTIPEEGIAPKRRQERDRRLGWEYTKLAIRRVDGGMWEEALEPLLRALNFQGVGADRQEETRGPLIRALDAIVDARSPLIQRLTDEGDRDGALVTCDKLWAFLRTAMERGIGKDELGPALEKTQQLFERLGEGKPGDPAPRSPPARSWTRRPSATPWPRRSLPAASVSATASCASESTSSRAASWPSASAPATTSSCGCRTASSGTS